MLKKRHSTVKVAIAMVIVALCAMGALYFIRSAYGFSRTYSVTLFAFIAIVLIFYMLSLTRWRDVVIVEQLSQYPPEGLNPIQTGCIIDGVVNDRDIVAGFYYLAEKRYMDIIEYELQRFEFKALNEPTDEADAIKILYRAIFNGEKSVKLVDAADRIAKAVPAVEAKTIKSIRKKKNREIANLTGKTRGFRKSLLNTKGEEAKAILTENPGYIYQIIPYAYEFAITAKLASNYDIKEMDPPVWYFPYGVDEDYKFDVIIYNSMLRNLPGELRKEVFDKLNRIQIAK
ncbi:MAG: DUF2207 domain-containing protein [Clostridiales bacterium]|nr:DUF2207 domain-containing protein [Candidatus Crickella equi]